jgi:hypothetical protein
MIMAKQLNLQREQYGKVLGQTAWTISLQKTGISKCKQE